MTQQTQAHAQTLDSLVCVVLDVHLWSGRRKLTPKDLQKVAPENLPPQDLASLGSKKICDPGELAEFGRLKRQAERVLLETGYRFLGGYGIPADKLDEVTAALQALRGEFEAYKAGFLSRYDQTVERWVSRHSEWESIIRKAVTPPEDVAERLRFDFRVFRVAPAGDADAGEDSLLDGSYHAIVRETARAACEAWERTFKGNAIVTQRALRPIRKMCEKLNGLSFIDPRIYPVVEQIDAALAACPRTGKIEGGPLTGLHSVVLLLADAKRMVAHGEAVIGNVNAAATPTVQADKASAEPSAQNQTREVIPETEAEPEQEPEPEADPEPEAPVPAGRRPVTSGDGLFF